MTQPTTPTPTTPLLPSDLPRSTEWNDEGYIFTQIELACRCGASHTTFSLEKLDTTSVLQLGRYEIVRRLTPAGNVRLSPITKITRLRETRHVSVCLACVDDFTSPNTPPPLDARVFFQALRNKLQEDTKAAAASRQPKKKATISDDEIANLF